MSPDSWRVPIGLTDAVQAVKCHWRHKHRISVAGTAGASFYAWRASFGSESVILLGRDTDECVRLNSGTVQAVWRVETSSGVQLVFDTREDVVTISLEKAGESPDMGPIH